ncbi:MAG: universal stress protein [Bacteriovoracaceae bacterium]
MNPKKVVIAVSLKKLDQKPLEKLKKSEWLEGAEIHLVHVIETVAYGVDLSPLLFPQESEYPKIRKEVIKELELLGKKLFPNTGRPKVITKCLFDYSANDAFCDYSKQMKADLIIVATRGKKGIKGFFDSSFARYMSKYAPADLMILRSNTK